ncbi:hypothetical protein ACFPH6_13435 [Streptomyces xiangluensis]|uniref:Uncharacterized protein n=1 Tax=Streptomyces xiangluensis TaxID=2665720 RepID=A0ABV8YJR0_9ACTN
MSGVVCLAAGMVNMIPWPGSKVRAMAALKLGSSEVFNPVLPTMGFGIAWALVASYLRCRQARNRLGALSPRGPATDVREGEVEWNDRETAASTAAVAAAAAESSRQVSHSHDGRRAGAAGRPVPPGDGPGPVRVPPLVNHPTWEQQQALLDEHAKSSHRTCRSSLERAARSGSPSRATGSTHRGTWSGCPTDREEGP